LKRLLHRIWKKRFLPSRYYDHLNKRFVKEKDAGKPGVRTYGVRLTKPKPEQFKFRQRYLGVRLRPKLPSRVDYRDLLSNGGFMVFDQGSQGSCTANCGCADKAFQEILSNTYGDPFSRAFLYYECRKLHGWENEDSGAEMEDIGIILGSEGVCLDSTMPYSQFDYTTPPDQEAIDEALAWTDDRDQTRLSWGEVKSALVEGPVMINNIPVGLPRIGVPIYSSFTSSEYNGGWVPIPQPTEELLGGHALLVVGYDDDLVSPSGVKGHYIVLNSWGRLQGARGYQYFPYDYEKWSGPQSDNWQQFDQTPGPGPGPEPEPPDTCEEIYTDEIPECFALNDFFSMLICAVQKIINYYLCAFGVKMKMTKKTSGRGDAKTMTLTFKKVNKK